MIVALLAAVASASNVELDVQTRLLDALGAPVSGSVDISVSLCPNAVPTDGESCYSEEFDSTLVSGGSTSADRTPRVFYVCPASPHLEG